MERLSTYFSWAEALSSVTAELNKIQNVPDNKVTGNILIAASMLDKVREKVGVIHVNSWYRCPELNRIIGGASNSAHMSGYAIDIHSDSLSPLELCRVIAGMGIQFDQIIHEYGQWCHVSFDQQNRKQLLTKFDGPYRKGLLSKDEYNRMQ